MKKIIFSFYSLATVAVLTLNGCSSPEVKEDNAAQKVQEAKQVVIEAKQDLRQAQQDVQDEFQKFKNEANEEIRINENRIAELRINIEGEDADLRERTGRRIDALEKRNHELKEKLEDFKDDGRNDWKEFKKEFKHDLDGLGEAFNNIGVRNTK